MTMNEGEGVKGDSVGESGGYRERVALKALLVERSASLSGVWTAALALWRYDPHLDELIAPSGERYPVKNPDVTEAFLTSRDVGFDDCRPSVEPKAENCEETRRVYVVGWAPTIGADGEPEAATGGFDWFESWDEVGLHLRGPGFLTSGHDYRIIGLDVPAGLTGDELTRWLDDDRELWEPPSNLPAELLEVKKADGDYLDDLAAALLGAEPRSNEERLLREVHGMACNRLGVDEVKHLVEATALGRVKIDVPPIALRAALALHEALLANHSEWLRAEPWKNWADTDCDPSDFFAELALRMSSRCAAGFLVDDRETLCEALVRICCSKVIEMEASLTSINFDVLEARVEAVLDLLEASR